MLCYVTNHLFILVLLSRIFPWESLLAVMALVCLSWYARALSLVWLHVLRWVNDPSTTALKLSLQLIFIFTFFLIPMQSPHCIASLNCLFILPQQFDIFSLWRIQLHLRPYHLSLWSFQLNSRPYHVSSGIDKEERIYTASTLFFLPITFLHFLTVCASGLFTGVLVDTGGLLFFWEWSISLLSTSPQFEILSSYPFPICYSPCEHHHLRLQKNLHSVDEIWHHWILTSSQFVVCDTVKHCQILYLWYSLRVTWRWSLTLLDKIAW